VWRFWGLAFAEGMMYRPPVAAPMVNVMAPDYSVPSPAEVRRILQDARAAREANARAVERQLAVSEDTLKLRFRL
jgi:hypothetical protein